MLVGTTFAWFTDTASTGVNTIQAGTLKIQLLRADDSSAEGETLKFIDLDQNEYWEPGCTYNLETVKVKNNGTLSLKYKIVLTGINGSAKLNEVIDWTLNGAAINPEKEYVLNPGESHEILIAGHMHENANNDYQELTIEGIAITVIATQNNAEYDSEDMNYDKNSTYPSGDNQ